MFGQVLVAALSHARRAGDSVPLQAYHALRPLLRAFEIPSDPVLSDLQTLGGMIEGMLEIVASMPPTADPMGKRANMIIDDEKATHRQARNSHALGHPAAGVLRTGVTAAPDLAYKPPAGGNGVGTGLWWCVVACQLHK